MVAKIAAIREAAPQLDIIIDANEAWTRDMLVQYSAALRKFNIAIMKFNAFDRLRRVFVATALGPATRQRLWVKNKTVAWWLPASLDCWW